MDAIQMAYDDLVNRVFEYAYLDLVDALIVERTERKAARERSVTAEQSRMHIKDAEKAREKAEYISKWFVDVTPKYRDIDGKMFRKWAEEEAKEYERTGHRRFHKFSAEVE